MERRILDLKDFTSGALWRRPEQLRGLIKNHSDVATASAPLQPDGALLVASSIALHNSEKALAVGLCPMTSASTVGLVGLHPREAGLRGCDTARRLSLPEGFQVSSLAWRDDAMFVGSSRGRVLLAELDAEAVAFGSSPLPISRVLLCGGDKAVGVGDLSSSPGAYASSAMVRSVSLSQVRRDAVAAVCGCHGVRWDLNGDVVPVRQWTVPGAERGVDIPVMFTEWAPGSSDVLLTGNYEGVLSLVDTRDGTNSCRSVSLQMPQGGTPVSMQFNPLLPYVFAVASSDGTVSVFDVRHNAEPLHHAPSLQGALTSVQWMGLHSDMLCTGGIDGSIALWNLRSPPTYCVGRAQFQLPIQHLAATRTFVRESVFGLTLAGEMTQVSLSTEAMRGLSSTLRSDYEEGADAELVAARVREEEVCGLMYTRHIDQGLEVLAECAEWRFARKETSAALELVELADPFYPENLSYDEVVAGTAGFTDPAKRNLDTATLAQGALRTDLVRSSRQLPGALAAGQVRDLLPANAEDIRRLASVRLNATLYQLLESRRLTDIFAGVPRALRLLGANPVLFDHIDADTVCDTVAFVLQTDVVEGERLVKLLLDLLREIDVERRGSRLVRCILETAQRPFITAGTATKQARRFEEKFFRDLDEAQEAVRTQLRILSLGLDNYADVIALAERYQGNCVENHQPGMFGWLSVKPLMTYLHCLTADSSYVTFLWTSVQYMETFSSFPGVRQIESTLFAVVDRIYGSGNKIATRLKYLSGLTGWTTAQWKAMRSALKASHNYVASILRVQLECENVAIDSQMRELPAVMARTLGALNDCTEEVLNAWAEVVDVLMASTQHKLVRSYCLPAIQEFAFKIEDLVEVSSKKENDDCLNEILDTCDEFLDALNPPTAAPAATFCWLFQSPFVALFPDPSGASSLDEPIAPRNSIRYVVKGNWQTMTPVPPWTGHCGTGCVAQRSLLSFFPLVLKLYCCFLKIFNFFSKRNEQPRPTLEMPLRRGAVDTRSGLRVRPLRRDNSSQKAVRPACEHCCAVYEASSKLVEAYHSLLTSIKFHFLEDTTRHVGEEDIWLRALRRFDIPEESYLGRESPKAQKTTSPTNEMDANTQRNERQAKMIHTQLSCFRLTLVEGEAKCTFTITFPRSERSNYFLFLLLLFCLSLHHASNIAHYVGWNKFAIQLLSQDTCARVRIVLYGGLILNYSIRKAEVP
eukprot:gene10102-7069_t